MNQDWTIILWLILFIMFMGLMGLMIITEVNYVTEHPCIKYENQCYYTTSVMVGKIITTQHHDVSCDDISARYVGQICVERK